MGALRAHVGVAAVQEAGCAAASNLAGSAEDQAAGRRAGVAELAHAAARNHPHHAEVQRLSAKLLGRF